MEAYPETIDQGQGKRRVTEDKISNLPDEVLIHILSFLQIREAVRTSSLSKRWNSLWTFLPTLTVYNFDSRKEDCFLDFLDKAMVHHEMPFLKKINIGCLLTEIDCSRIYSWISAVAKLDVRSLEICSRGGQEPLFNLPSCLFTMSNLVTLSLTFRMRLSFPVASNFFPNLKELILGLLIYEDDESVQNLISSCPVLEEFCLNREGFEGLKDFNVSSRSLKSLAFNVCNCEEEEVDDVSKITIDCPAVEYVRIFDDQTEEFIVRDMSSLVKAKLDLSNYRYAFHELGSYARHVFELLTVFAKIKILSVSESTMRTMSAADGEILPTFHNMKRLRFFGSDEGNWSMAAIIEFLKSTPVLEVLVFKGFTFSLEEFDSYSADVPSCLISHLKTIKVNGYFGKHDEEKVRYFLENSKVLESMIFKQKGADFMENIRHGSSTCRISVSVSR